MQPGASQHHSSSCVTAPAGQPAVALRVFGFGSLRRMAVVGALQASPRVGCDAPIRGRWGCSVHEEAPTLLRVSKERTEAQATRRTLVVLVVVALILAVVLALVCGAGIGFVTLGVVLLVLVGVVGLGFTPQPRPFAMPVPEPEAAEISASPTKNVIRVLVFLVFCAAAAYLIRGDSGVGHALHAIARLLRWIL